MKGVLTMNPSDQPSNSADLFGRAQKVLAAGVSSDARRVAPGRVPLYVDHAKGAYLWDVDGRQYLDFVMGQGPMVLGHCAPEVVAAIQRQSERGLAYAAQHELEVVAAELLTSLVPCADLVRFNTVGSEAVLGAWRIARGATGRQRILKFEGHYHGWLDAALWSVHPDLKYAGTNDSPVPVPGTGGQQLSSGSDLLIAPWNDLEAFGALMAEHGHEVAAVVMEPVLCNTGCIEPDPAFLAAVVDITHSAGGLVIFDEVITGFRLGTGGAQEYLGVVPDIAIFGKAIAGGMPVAAIAGSRAVMDVVTRGEVGHAGTFNSNPLGMAAAVATLQTLANRREEIYPHMYSLGARLKAGLTSIAEQSSIPLLVDGPGPMLQTYFTEALAVRNYRDFVNTDRASASRFHEALFDRGVNIVGRGLWFLSAAHSDQDVDRTLQIVEEIFAQW
jgi:glutamate-1-semialdehyde 2,1-aminomutase